MERDLRSAPCQYVSVHRDNYAGHSLAIHALRLRSDGSIVLTPLSEECLRPERSRALLILVWRSRRTGSGESPVEITHRPAGVVLTVRLSLTVPKGFLAKRN